MSKQPFFRNQCWLHLIFIADILGHHHGIFFNFLGTKPSNLFFVHNDPRSYMFGFVGMVALWHKHHVYNSNPNAGLATICAVWQLWENVPTHSRLWQCERQSSRKETVCWCLLRLLKWSEMESKSLEMASKDCTAHIACVLASQYKQFSSQSLAGSCSTRDASGNQGNSGF